MNQNKISISQRIFDFFSSVKLAVPLLLSMAVVFAVGTFYEAEYGTADAQRVIYKSWYVSLLMFLLIVNLTCAAIDRLPWKKHHIGFVTTHAGIIILIMGSFITQQQGIDASLPLAIDETADSILLPDTELQVYQSLNGRPFAILAQKPVDFDRSPPEKKPFSLPLVDDDVLKVTGYLQKAERIINVEETKDPKAEAALQFKLFNEQVQVEEWLGLDGKIPPFYDLGPALITFIKGPVPKNNTPRNQLVFFTDGKNLNYSVFSARKTEIIDTGRVEVGKEYSTGWMNLKFKINHFYPKALGRAAYVTAADRNSQTATAAIKVNVGNQESWFEIGSPHDIKSEKSTYFVNYTFRRFPLGFQIQLKKFKLATYGGSQLPMSYESTVRIGGNETVISMNEPLEHNGFLFYQSSYELNERGEPAYSVFSVNYDPGRKLKYLGSILIVVGIAIMFYLKPRWSRKPRTETTT